MLMHSPLMHRGIMHIPDMTLPSAVFAAEDGRVTLNYLLELYPSSGVMVAAARYAFITLPTDTLSNQPFAGTLDKVLTFSRSIVGGDGFGGVSESYGEFELNNAGGDYDALLSQTIDGRPFTLKALWMYAGNIPAPYQSAAILLNGIAQDWHFDDKALRVTIQDRALKLDVPASPNKYAGTGGLEGTSDMAGKCKPQAWGDLTPSAGSGGNITPPLVKPSTLIYQWNDGASQALTAVYDGGLALTPTSDHANLAALEGATLGNGSYASCLALSIFRLGGAPAALITCDARGESTSGYVNDTASIIRRWLSIAAPTIDLIDEGSFTALSAAQPAPVGFYMGLDDNRTLKQVIEELLGGIGGWCGFRRDGMLDCGRFVLPAGDPVASYTPVDIIEDTLKRLELPGGVNPPPKRWRVTWGRNWTVQPEVFGGVSATRAQMLKEPYSVAESSNTSLMATIAAAHKEAQDPEPVQAFFRDAADAVAEADRRLTLYGAATRSLYSFRVKSKGFVHNIGHVLHATYPRLDLVAGKLAAVVANNDDVPADQVELTVFL